MMLCIVDDAELARCHTVDLVFTVDGIRAVAMIFDCCLVVVGRVTDLERDMLGQRRDAFC